MIVTQPDRILLHDEIRRHGPVLRGAVLDAGSGRFNRYHSLCRGVEKFTTLDTDTSWKPDIVGSVEAIAAETSTFDGILCTQVLEHVAHPEKAMREMARVLKSGGTLLLTVPQMNELHEVPHDFFRYTRFGLETLLKDAGFSVQVMEQRGKYHATLAQMRIRMLIDRFDPYKNKIAMLFIAPLSKLMTSWALMRDNMTTSDAVARQTIGWCVVAVKN